MLKWDGVLIGRSCFLLSCRLLLFYEVLPALRAWLGVCGCVCEIEADTPGGFCCMCTLITVSYLIGGASFVSSPFCASGVLLTTCAPTRWERLNRRCGVLPSTVALCCLFCFLSLLMLPQFQHYITRQISYHLQPTTSLSPRPTPLLLS